jgi:hypothetical protein
MRRNPATIHFRILLASPKNKGSVFTNHGHTVTQLSDRYL